MGSRVIATLVLCVLAPGVSSAQVLNCDEIWVAGFPTDDREPALTLGSCEEYPVDRTQPGPGNFRVFHPADWLNERRIPQVEALIEATRQSLDVFAELGDLPEIYVMITTAAGDASAGTADGWHLPYAAEPCPVVVFPPALEFERTVKNHVMAHEVFHCFQDHHFRSRMFNPSHPATEWWVEGSASYSENLPFPDSDLEHGVMTEYDPDEPLQLTSYPASLFFLDWSNAGGPGGLLAFFEAMPSTGGLDEQVRATSRIDGIDGRFHAFGQHYIDSDIADPGGRFLPHAPDRGRRIVVAGNGEHVIAATPFTLGRAILEFAAAGVYSLEITDAGPAGLESAEPLDQRRAWQPLPDLVYTDCDESLEYQVLLTTTKATSQQRRITIDIQREGNGACLCDERVPNVELDACLVGDWQQSDASLADALIHRGILSSHGPLESMGGRQLLKLGRNGQMVSIYEDIVFLHRSENGYSRTRYHGIATGCVRSRSMGMLSGRRHLEVAFIEDRVRREHEELLRGDRFEDASTGVSVENLRGLGPDLRAPYECTDERLTIRGREYTRSPIG